MFRSSMCVLLIAAVLVAVVPQPAVAAAAAPLTGAEMSHYAQLQASALQSQSLDRTGGQNVDTTTVLVVAIVVVALVVVIIYVF
jgi:hypothetical protein